jgi:hypothetical protein
LFGRQRLKHLERHLRSAAYAVRGTENQPSTRMAGDYFQDFARLLGGEFCIPLQQARGVSERNIQRAVELRGATQLNIRSIPNS